MGLWRIPGRHGANGSALVEPVSAARLTAELALALPGSFRGLGREGYRSDGAATAIAGIAARS